MRRPPSALGLLQALQLWIGEPLGFLTIECFLIQSCDVHRCVFSARSAPVSGAATFEVGSAQVVLKIIARPTLLRPRRPHSAKQIRSQQSQSLRLMGGGVVHESVRLSP